MKRRNQAQPRTTDDGETQKTDEPWLGERKRLDGREAVPACVLLRDFRSRGSSPLVIRSGEADGNSLHCIGFRSTRRLDASRGMSDRVEFRRW